MARTTLKKELKMIRKRLDSIEEALGEEMTEDDKRALRVALEEHRLGKTTAKCTCPNCTCRDTWECLHAGKNPARLPSGEMSSFCKCCVDNTALPLDEDTGHKPEFTKKSTPAVGRPLKKSKKISAPAHW